MIFNSKWKKPDCSEEFTYRGVLDREQKISFLQSLDILSVPATYDEPKGIFLLEAMACGIPVVQPRRGGFTEIVERTGGGLLVEPDDVDSLAQGILKTANEPTLREQLCASGFTNVREHYTVQRDGRQCTRGLQKDRILTRGGHVVPPRKSYAQG